MPKPPAVGEISRALNYGIDNAREYAGDLLEDVNDHWTAHALWSMNLGDVALACDFLQLAAAVEESEEGLTPDLHERSNELLSRFKEAQENPDDEGEEEDE